MTGVVELALKPWWPDSSICIPTHYTISCSLSGWDGKRLLLLSQQEY